MSRFRRRGSEGATGQMRARLTGCSLVFVSEMDDYLISLTSCWFFLWGSY